MKIAVYLLALPAIALWVAVAVALIRIAIGRSQDGPRWLVGLNRFNVIFLPPKNAEERRQAQVLLRLLIAFLIMGVSIFLIATALRWAIL